MDTGSDLVWMQCEGCTKCFDQTPKPFPAKNSSSFRPILIKTTPKPYNYTYADGSTTNGILGRETFYLRSKSGKLAKIPNIKFGCGLHNDMPYKSLIIGNKIAGIMGLGWNDLSFVKQLGSKINGKFSYCLPLLSGKTSNSYLKFGDDCKCLLKSTKKTPLYRINGTSPYFVDLQGISINKTRLKINPNVFAFNNSSGPGCIIDTGTPISRIKTPAFEILKQELEKHISRLKGLKRLSGCLGGLELCYERIKPEKGVDSLPEVTFHLRGSKADFVMKTDAVFKFFDRDRAVGSRERLCLAMVSDDMMSIIGSRQQVNQMMTYDIKKSLLIFYQRDCAK
ncbi:aspartic proteinase nepenthesin-1 [Phtheirospermum japonicum]|uniref:Aspartic proteinase nepenthesin-1 n=1 Tax=Phtheirospermum japonicum TaxID=374723 RepID=A0A830BC93_9LAMI|nr:aspartic proteinase nepenthesin-1 [Phtheirospermum japonicum]